MEHAGAVVHHLRDVVLGAKQVQARTGGSAARLVTGLAALLVAGVSALLLALVWGGGEHPWGSTTIIGLLGALITLVLPRLAVLGGGPIGRMLAQAAQTLGYRVHVFDPVGPSPAGAVAHLGVIVRVPVEGIGMARLHLVYRREDLANRLRVAFGRVLPFALVNGVLLRNFRSDGRGVGRGGVRRGECESCEG